MEGLHRTSSNVAFIIKAINYMQQNRGISYKNLLQYMNSEQPNKITERDIKLALKKALEHGFLISKSGKYMIPEESSCKCPYSEKKKERPCNCQEKKKEKPCTCGGAGHAEKKKSDICNFCKKRKPSCHCPEKKKSPVCTCTKKAKSKKSCPVMKKKKKKPVCKVMKKKPKSKCKTCQKMKKKPRMKHCKSEASKSRHSSQPKIEPSSECQCLVCTARRTAINPPQPGSHIIMTEKKNDNTNEISCLQGEDSGKNQIDNLKNSISLLEKEIECARNLKHSSSEDINDSFQN